MSTVRVKANVNIYGLAVDDVADVPDDGEWAALIEAGFVSVVHRAPAATAPDDDDDDDAPEVT